MCDYSLMSVPNRLAQKGEELVTYRFSTGSLGLAPFSNLHPERSQAAPAPRTFWSTLKKIFNCSQANSIPAVCIPPGARLTIEIDERWRRELGCGRVVEVTFTQLTTAVNSYRDAIRLPNGREVLLQQLKEDLRVRVLSLSPADESDSRTEELLSRVSG